MFFNFFQECIEWAKEEKRTFLRQSLESRLVGLYFETERYQDALALGSALLKELKKLDDKNLLVEVQLLESKTYHALQNLPKARAALTSARTTANSIYVPPRVQAQLDLQVSAEFYIIKLVFFLLIIRNLKALLPASFLLKTLYRNQLIFLGYC